MIEILPLDFVAETLLQLLATDNHLDLALLARLGFYRSVKDRLLLGRHPSRCLSSHLAIGPVLVSPFDVCCGRLLQVLFNMVEGVSVQVLRTVLIFGIAKQDLLCNVCDTQVRVLFHLAGIWYCFTREQLDECRLVKISVSD